MPLPVHWKLAVVAMFATLASACSTLGYVTHVARGQAQLLLERRPLAKVIADPHTDAAQAARLRIAQRAREFASEHLHLPDNRSYKTFVDVHRPFVVWNVFAAPRYSVDAILHCFPIAGCVPYRGYFSAARAQAEAARLEARGDDVYVGGVSAYSTLGWFADPILSTMLRADDDELVGTMFHELAHQLIYVKDDSAFNESFANFVQDEGLREWRIAQGLPPDDAQHRRTDDDFVRLALDLRERLRTIYASGIGNAAMATAKDRAIADFRTRYAQWREAHWPEDHRYDGWVAKPINNAALLPFGLYDAWLPAFAALFHASDDDWQRFYARVRELAQQSKNARDAALRGAIAPR